MQSRASAMTSASASASSSARCHHHRLGASASRSRTWMLRTSQQARSCSRRASVQCHAADGRSSSASAPAAAVPVRFAVQLEVNYGEAVRVVGNQSVLGSWDAGRGLELSWNEGHVWAAVVELEAGARVEFKLVRVGNGATVWEDGDNRRFDILGPGHSLDVHCSFGDTAAREVRSKEMAADGGGEGGGGGGPHFEDLATAVAASAASRKAAAAAAAAAERRPDSGRASSSSGGGGGGSDSDSRGSSNAASTDEDSLLAPQWQGRDVVFMRSNDHTRERSGRWDASRLAAGSPERALVEGDERAPNWLAKLGVVRQLLVDDAPRMRPEADALAAAYVYLSWVGSGAVPCVEGGGHHRPNHHARASQQIFRSLEWAIEEDRPRGPADLTPRLRALLARRMQLRLPSFDASFTQSVPLTRIRDIAHRGDIPHELKQEIKHTLQNKLHRNAGPEDLVATQAMLARVTAVPGQYPDAFVEEFKAFARELREFFNAAPLASTLEGLRGVLEADPADAQTLDGFLAAKARLDERGDSPDVPLSELMGVAHAATTLRALLLRALSSGLRNDAPDAALAMRQRFRLGELRCEEYVFVLLSRFVNALEREGGATALAAARSSIAWSHPLAVLLLGVRNLGLGGWMPAECMAIENEVTVWQQEASYDERDNALRLKATLERCLRLTEGFTDVLLEALPPRAEALGSALGLEEWAIRAFAEGEVRASLVFQVSKLAALLLVAARSLAGVTPWDTLVAGTAVGTLVDAPSLDPALLAGETRPVVLLLRGADGDEEVAAAGRCVRGIVLTQELPHLSHLGVRARQERVPFVTIEDRAVIGGEVEPLIGQAVALVATPEGAQVRRATDAEVAAAAASSAASHSDANGSNGSNGVTPLSVSRVTTPTVLPLADCAAARGGAKAAACAQLEQLSVKSAAAGGGAGGFRAPPGVCVPFGVMELAVAALPAAQRSEYADLLAAAETAPVAELDAVCGKLQALARSLRVPDAVLRAVVGAFPPGTPLICRSSANVEDLSGMSGAGLYDSVPNVPSDSAADVAAAITEVWASLHTRRAVLSRRAAGVAQADASMAVLVQLMLSPQLSFVLHTASPLGDAPGTAVAEIAVGLGETLASGQRGSAWRLAVDKRSGDTTTLAFANFAQALLPAAPVGAAAAAGAGAGTGGASGGGGSGGGKLYKCTTRILDYSQMALSRSADARKQVGKKLGAVAGFLEAEFGGPQDVEGCLIGDTVFVVQTRPQPM